MADGSLESIRNLTCIDRSGLGDTLPWAIGFCSPLPKTDLEKRYHKAYRRLEELHELPYKIYKHIEGEDLERLRKFGRLLEEVPEDMVHKIFVTDYIEYLVQCVEEIYKGYEDAFKDFCDFSAELREDTITKYKDKDTFSKFLGFNELCKSLDGLLEEIRTNSLVSYCNGFYSKYINKIKDEQEIYVKAINLEGGK